MKKGRNEVAETQKITLWHNQTGEKKDIPLQDITPSVLMKGTDGSLVISKYDHPLGLAKKRNVLLEYFNGVNRNDQTNNTLIPLPENGFIVEIKGHDVYPMENGALLLIPPALKNQYIQGVHLDSPKAGETVFDTNNMPVCVNVFETADELRRTSDKSPERWNSPTLQSEISLAAEIDEPFRKRIQGFSTNFGLVARGVEQECADEARQLLGFKIATDYKFPEGKTYDDYELEFMAVKALNLPPHERYTRVKKYFDKLKSLNPEEFEKFPDVSFSTEKMYHIVLGCTSRLPPESITDFIEGKSPPKKYKFELQHFKWIPADNIRETVKENIRRLGFPEEQLRPLTKEERHEETQNEAYRTVGSIKDGGELHRFMRTVSGLQTDMDEKSQMLENPALWHIREDQMDGLKNARTADKINLEKIHREMPEIIRKLKEMNPDLAAIKTPEDDREKMKAFLRDVNTEKSVEDINRNLWGENKKSVFLKTLRNQNVAPIPETTPIPKQKTWRDAVTFLFRRKSQSA